MNEASAITDAVTPTSPTAYGSSQRGAEPSETRMTAPSRPVRSATVTARRIVTTVTSGGNSMKFGPRLTVSQARPSPVNRPRTAVGSSVPGMVTETSASWSAVEITPTIRNSPRNSMNGSGSLLPTRSMPLSRRSVRVAVATDRSVMGRLPSADAR